MIIVYVRLKHLSSPNFTNQGKILLHRVSKHKLEIVDECCYSVWRDLPRARKDNKQQNIYKKA
jgi:hypothetical protein